jgi:hypothetical protein
MVSWRLSGGGRISGRLGEHSAPGRRAPAQRLDQFSERADGVLQRNREEGNRLPTKTPIS